MEEQDADFFEKLVTEDPDYQHIVKAEKAAKRKAKRQTQAQKADQLIADEAALFQADSTARSSTSGVIQPTPSSDKNSRSKACSIIHIGCNEIQIPLARGMTIPTKSPVIGKTRVQSKRIHGYPWKVARSHGTPKKIHVDENFVFGKDSKTAGVLLRNKSSREFTIAKDAEVAKVHDDGESARTKQFGVARSHMLSRASKSKAASTKFAP